MNREDFEHGLERTFERKHANFARIFGSRADEAYMVLSEYFFYPKGSYQRIGIRTLINMRGEYGYQCSHGSGYRSSINNCFESEESALHSALAEALSGYKYDEDDEDRDEKWVQNDDYYVFRRQKRASGFVSFDAEEAE